MAKSGTVQNPFLFGAGDVALQRFLMLGIMVAGKHAGVQQQKLDQLLDTLGGPFTARQTIFDQLHALYLESGSPHLKIGADAQKFVREEKSLLVRALLSVKTGQYTKLAWSFTELGRRKDEINLRFSSRDHLCSIPGVGMKTASFFIMFTRPGAQMVCLDTHILRYMRETPGFKDVPLSTPPSRTPYLILERQWLKHCERLGRVPAELDFELWSKASKTMKNPKFLTQL